MVKTRKIKVKSIENEKIIMTMIMTTIITQIIIIVMIICVIIVFVIIVVIIISSFSMLLTFIFLVFTILFSLCIYRMVLNFKQIMWPKHCSKLALKILRLDQCF